MKATRLAILCAAVVLAAVPAMAQQDQNQGDPGGRRMFGGGGFVQGTVQSVDAASRSVEVKQDDGTVRKISVPEGAQIMRSETTKVSGLKAGDQVTVVGTPLSVLATQIRLREGAGNAAPGGGPGGNPGGGQFGGRQGGGGMQTFITGTIESFYTPNEEQKKKQQTIFSIKLEDKSQVFVMIDPKSVLQKTSAVQLGAVKVGERVTTMGQPGGDGAIQARFLMLGESAGPGFGGRMFGGRSFGGGDTNNPDFRNPGGRRDRGNWGGRRNRDNSTGDAPADGNP